MALQLQSCIAQAPPGITRRRRQSSTSSRKNDVQSVQSGSFLLFFLNNPKLISICCSSKQIIVENGSTIAYDTSVTLEASSSVNWSRYIKTSFQLANVTSRSSTNTFEAKLVSQQNTFQLPYFSTILSTSFEPLLSLSLVLESVHPLIISDDKGSIEDQPLLLSCLKSQLIGLFVAWEANQIDSIIRVQLMNSQYCLRTKSVVLSPQSSRNAGLVFRILPNTKITITSDKNSSETVNRPILADPTQFLLSPTAKYLVDTLQCLQKNLQSMPVASLLRFVLLAGPPGTGKTFAVKSAVQSIPSCELVSIQGSQIMAIGHVGEATRALQRTFEKAGQKNAPTIIFLDEFDALVTSESMATVLGTLMDRISHQQACTILVAATNRVDVLPAALRRRFDHEIVMTPPGPQERAEILTALLGQGVNVNEVDIPSSAQLLELARDCVGCVPAF